MIFLCLKDQTKKCLKTNKHILKQKMEKKSKRNLESSRYSARAEWAGPLGRSWALKAPVRPLGSSSLRLRVRMGRPRPSRHLRSVWSPLHFPPPPPPTPPLLCHRSRRSSASRSAAPQVHHPGLPQNLCTVQQQEGITDGSHPAKNRAAAADAARRRPARAVPWGRRARRFIIR